MFIVLFVIRVPVLNSFHAYDCFPHPPNPFCHLRLWRGVIGTGLGVSWGADEGFNGELLARGSVGLLESIYYGSIQGKGYDIGVCSKHKGLPLAGFRWILILESQRGLGLWRWHFWEGTTSQMDPKMMQNALIYIHDDNILIYIILYIYICMCISKIHIIPTYI